MHHLQQLFASGEGEAVWTEEMHALFVAGALDQAESVLRHALAALDSEVGAMCLALRREDVVLDGWDDLAEAIALFEGERVTGVTIAIANEQDRAFEKGLVHHPYVMLGIYTDEGFAFSAADADSVMAELEKEFPDWSGHEEDIEVHLDIEGLDRLNTALLHHKQRHFFRDEAPAQAPLRYVEYVLGCWWRALRWQQAVAAAAAEIALPGAVTVVSGMVDMRPEALCIHPGTAGVARPESALAVAAPEARNPVLDAGFGDGFIRRGESPVEEAPPTGIELRRRAAAAAEAAAEESASQPARPRFLARLFGWR